MNEVKSGLITSRRIIFTPAVDLKDELANTAIQITCYDRNGDEVKRVTSSDAGNVEDPDTSTEDQSGNSGSGSSSGTGSSEDENTGDSGSGSGSGSGNSDSNSTTPGEGD